MLRSADKRLQLNQGLRDLLRDPHSRYGDLGGYGRELYRLRVLEDAPKVFYEMQEESGNPQDTSGNALHITSTTGTPDYRQPGPMGDFAIFLESGEKFSRAHVSTLVNNFTMEAIIKVQTVSGSRAFLHNGNSAANGWGVMVNDELRLRFLAGGVATGGYTSGKLVSGAFNHIVCLRRAGTWEIWINGTEDPVKGTTTPNTPNGSLTVQVDSSLESYYAYIAVYETALSASRISEHYAATGLYH